MDTAVVVNPQRTRSAEHNTDAHITVIVKIAERCNLGCSYCYMYRCGNETWKQRPAFLSREDINALTQQFIEHSRINPDAFRLLEIHGGEPLLLGKRRMRQFLSTVREALPPSELTVGLQTNGTLLDMEWLEILAEFDVRFGISCDGPPHIHDLHRTFHNGARTGAIVEQAIRMCVNGPYQHLFGGVLAVANPDVDGAEVVRYFTSLGVRNLDLLLPDANYVLPPVHLQDYQHDKMLRFLTSAFDEWIRGGADEISIRLFLQMIRGLLGGRPTIDGLGGDISSLLVVESDGTYQLVDVLRICGEEEARTPFHVRTHTFQDFLSYAPSVVPTPCATCLKCRAYSSCGGGYVPHRFDGHGYDNPSYHCQTLLGLYDHMTKYIRIMPKSVRSDNLESEWPA